MKHSHSFSIRSWILSGVFAFLATDSSHAAVNVLIEPISGGTQARWTVSWDSLAGATTFLEDWNSMNPADGTVLTSSPWGFVGSALWVGVGSYSTFLYQGGIVGGFGDGVDGVVSAPSGFGVVPHESGDNQLLYLFHTSNSPFPFSGSFTLTVDAAAGGFTNGYNPGVYSSNPNVTVDVVPEPSRALLAILGLGAVMARRRR